MILLIAAAPRLPPIIMTTGLFAVKLQRFKALRRSPERSSLRIGVPVNTALPAGRCLIVSGKLQQTLVAAGIDSLFARPGVISDSVSYTHLDVYKRQELFLTEISARWTGNRKIGRKRI